MYFGQCSELCGVIMDLCYKDYFCDYETFLNFLNGKIKKNPPIFVYVDNPENPSRIKILIDRLPKINWPEIGVLIPGTRPAYFFPNDASCTVSIPNDASCTVSTTPNNASRTVSTPISGYYIPNDPFCTDSTLNDQSCNAFYNYTTYGLCQYILEILFTFWNLLFIF